MIIKKSKGFTMIEVLTVIAILGIIILLAAPKFLSYMEAAKLAQIKNDVRAHENHIESKLVIHPDYIDDWDFISNQQLEELRVSSKLYDRTGLIEESETVVFTQDNKIIPKKTINTKLKGIFIFDNNGKVYYYDGKVEAVERLACEDAELQGYICIYTIEDLRRISHDMSAKYILMNDLDLSSIENWQPIGHETGEVLTFTGEFNGNNYSIKNFKINESEWDLYGYALFSKVKDSTFKNISIKDPSIFIGEGEQWGASFISPLVGWSSGGDSFENISVENLQISGEDSATFAGSIVGKTEGADFKNISLNNSVVYGNDFVGGVTGQSVNSTFENISILNSKIDGEASFAGGVVGDSKSSIVKKVRLVNSDVKGYGFVGGVTGMINSGDNEISDVEIQGTIEGETAFTGGIVGQLLGGLDANEIKVNVELLSGEFTGGLIGFISAPSLEEGKPIFLENVNVQSSIKISPYYSEQGREIYASGGIIGKVDVQDGFELGMKNVKASGDIHTREYAGGIIGSMSERRTMYGTPTPIQKTVYFEDVSSSINFIEVLRDPENRDGDGYFSVGGIVGSIPDEGTVKLDLKNVYYDGDMNLSDYYTITEINPIHAFVWRKISPIVPLELDYYDGKYVIRNKSLVETENVYWIKENSPELEAFDFYNLGK